jgi:small subunit ribosomal protein S4e
MAHLKKLNIGKSWPVPKKGTKYSAVANHNHRESIPLIVVMRDILKIVRNRRELQKSLNDKQILVNKKVMREVNFPISVFDVINIPKIKKNYKADLSENKKMCFKEISDKESESKVYKILSRKILSRNKLQLNLSGGKNLLSSEDVKTGDSVVVRLEDNEIIKVLTLEKGRDVFVAKGGHAGNRGKIEGIIDRGGKSLVKISSEKGKINVWVKNVIVVG